MATEELCPTNLLDDAPAEDDEFGSHERVAKAIVKLLETEGEGGKSIGLEGGWGSGKSTVVRLIEKKLSRTKTGDFRVAVFDMWAHQDDPLRRTFLENLIERVQDFGWVNKSRWELRRDKLAKRRSEETTRVLPRLTLAGMLFAVTLLAIPVGSGLISAGATLLASKDAPGDWAGYFLLIGTVGVFLPLFWYLIVAAIRKLQNRSGEDGEGMSEFSALVTGQSSTKSHTIATRTPDPTSVEFESEFRDLLDEALDSRKKRKLLLVVDNLDRVQSSDALSIWSTLQTFLGYSEHKKTEWLDRLWVLIPYDGDAILRLWDQSDDFHPKSPNQTLTETFLNKTFQIRFSVPPLLLVNWRAFLNGVLTEAFSERHIEEFPDIHRAFGINGGIDKSPPTPRDLKIFVNQIGALHRDRQHDFLLSDYACYVLLVKDVTDLHRDLLSGVDHKLPRRIIGDNWRDIIAAIHFGVSEDEARQLLLRGPIETALADGDACTLSDLRTAHPEGFWAVLDDCVPTGADNWNNLNSGELAKAAATLADSKVFDHAGNRREAEAMRSIVGTSALSVKTWTSLNVENAEGMFAIVELVNAPEELIPTLLTGATKAYFDETPAEEWVSGAFALVEGLDELGFGETIAHGVIVPLSADEWIKMSTSIAENDRQLQLLHYFEIQAIHDLDVNFSGRLQSNQLDDSVVVLLQTALATRSKNQLNETASAALNLLAPGTRLQLEQLTNALKLIRLLDAAGLIATSEYAELANSGRMLHYLRLAHANRIPEAVAESVFGFLRIVPDAHETTRFGDSYAGHQYLTDLLRNPNSVPDVVKHFINIAKETKQIAAVVEMASAQLRPVPLFLARVLSALLNLEDVSVTVDLMRNNWGVMQEAFVTSGEPQGFESLLRRSPGFKDLVYETANGGFDAGESGLYVALLRCDAGADFANWCANGLTNVDQPTWTESMVSQGELLALVDELNKRGSEMTFGDALFDALVMYAKEIAQGPDQLLAPETWDLLVGMLDSRQRERLPRHVYSLLEEAQGGVSPSFYEFFGQMLANGRLLSKESDFIDRVCRPIVVNDNAKGLEWLAHVADTNPRMLSRHSDRSGVDYLADRVRQRISDTQENDPKNRHLKIIGATLGVY